LEAVVDAVVVLDDEEVLDDVEEIVTTADPAFDNVSSAVGPSNENMLPPTGAMASGERSTDEADINNDDDDGADEDEAEEGMGSAEAMRVEDFFREIEDVL